MAYMKPWVVKVWDREVLAFTEWFGTRKVASAWAARWNAMPDMRWKAEVSKVR